MIETGGSEKQQAKALKLLFTLIRQSPRHAEEFKATNGYAMLAKVLMSDRAIISMDLLKVCMSLFYWINLSNDRADRYD